MIAPFHIITIVICRAYLYDIPSPSNISTFKILGYLITESALTRFKHHIISRVSRPQTNLFHDYTLRKINLAHKSKYVRALSS